MRVSTDEKVVLVGVARLLAYFSEFIWGIAFMLFLCVLLDFAEANCITLL